MVNDAPQLRDSIGPIGTVILHCKLSCKLVIFLEWKDNSEVLLHAQRHNRIWKRIFTTSIVYFCNNKHMQKHVNYSEREGATNVTLTIKVSNQQNYENNPRIVALPSLANQWLVTTGKAFIDCQQQCWQKRKWKLPRIQKTHESFNLGQRECVCAVSKLQL